MKNSYSTNFNCLINICVVLSFLCIFNFIAESQITAQQWYKANGGQSTKLNFNEVRSSFNEYWKEKTPQKGTGWKQFKRWEAFWEPRLFETNEIPNGFKIYKEWNNYLENSKNRNQTLANSQWKLLGPTFKPQKSNPNSKEEVGLGRMNCIAFDPSNNQVLWAGAAYGGVWKSTDGGNSWNTFPFTNFLSIGVSDIAVSPNNPNIVYAATGDADGSLSGNANYSIGVIKTTDGGANWSLSGLQYEIDSCMIINKMIVNPTNPDIVYAATSQGLYATTNGGTNWYKMYDVYFRDIKFKPGNPDIFYGAVVTINTNRDTIYAVMKCSVTEGKCNSTIAYLVKDVKRIALAVTPANPEYIYAICVASDLGFANVIRSTNGGTSWDSQIQRPPSPNYLSEKFDGSAGISQGHYDLCIAASPADANEVYIGGVNVWKSTNGGKNWFLTAEWTGNYSAPWVHADHHALEFSPNHQLYSCNDGGIQKTVNGGLQWMDLSNGLSVTQFYRISSAKTSQGIVYGGTQDNGTHRLLASSWQNVLGGDGMDCAIDQNNYDIVYASLYYGDFHKTTDGGQTFSTLINSTVTKENAGWVSPFMIDPSNSKNLFAGFQNLWKSTNFGASWSKISNFSSAGVVTSLAVAPSNSNYIYVGKLGATYKTTDGGANWTQILQGGVITGIAIDPKNPNRAWFSNSGYTTGEKVYYFDGTTLTKISGTLPNVPVNCIVYQNDSPDGLYIGTDLGVFYKDNRLSDWQPFNSGLPNVVVNDLEIHYASKKIRAATFGRGLWENDIVSCTGAIPTVQVKGKNDICEGDSVRLEAPSSYVKYEWSNGSTQFFTYAKTEGNYTVTVTDGNNCSYTSAPVSITVHSAPSLTIRYEGDSTFCKGDSITLSAIPKFGFTTYTWSNNMTGRTIVVKESGNYTVTGTTSYGCTRTSPSINVRAYELPQKPVIKQSNDTLYCEPPATTYQWYYNDNMLINATKQFYRIQKGGRYTVKVTNEHNCANISDVFEVTDVDDGNETAGYYLKLEPNPSPGLFNLETRTKGNEKFDIVIYNLQGKSILELKNIEANGIYRKQIDLQKIPSGVYIINVTFQGIQLSKKLIKE